MRMGRIAVTVGVFVALLTTGGASAAPATFHLVFDGRHNAELLHEGSFTSSSSLCPSGTAADVSLDAANETSLRRFSCAGGGDFMAKISPLPAEHGGNGVWQIVDGSGPLAKLRGKGSFSSTRLAGRSDDPATITFRATWDGVADFDVEPPTVSIKRSTVKRLRRPKGAFSVRLGLGFTGDTDVSYVLQVADPRKPGNTFAYKVGTTSTGFATLTFRIKPPKSTRLVQLKIDAEDAVGNSATFAKSVRIR